MHPPLQKYSEEEEKKKSEKKKKKKKEKKKKKRKKERKKKRKKEKKSDTCDLISVFRPAKIFPVDCVEKCQLTNSAFAHCWLGNKKKREGKRKDNSESFTA